MKAVLFVLALALIATAYALPLIHSNAGSIGISRTNENQSCSANYSCAEEGDDCESALNCSYSDGNCCATGLRCYNNGDDTECATDNIGDSCSASSDCFSQYTGVELNCVNKTCVLQYYTNDECDEDSDCVSGNCTDEVCQGIPEGGDCTSYNTLECAYGLGCIHNATDSTCQALTPEGGDCTDVPCIFGYTCAQPSAKCIPMYSVGENGDCTADSFDECQGDYVCVNSKCVEGQEWDQEDCDSDSDCPTGQYCYCSSYSGDKICLGNSANLTVGDSFDDLYSCIREHNCTAVSNAPDSCTQENCDSDYSDTQDDSCNISDALYDSCYVNPDCGGFPVWAIIVIAVVAVILVLVIIVVAVMCMKRKRNDYDSI